jgi:hypothetical protein
MDCVSVVAASAVKGAESLALIEEEAVATEMAAVSVADGTDPFASFLAFCEPFLAGGTPAAAEQAAAAKSGISAPADDEVAVALTAVEAAVAKGEEMPDGDLVPSEPASRTKVSSAGAVTGEAAPAAAPEEAPAEPATTWQLLRILTGISFAGAILLGRFFPTGLNLAMMEIILRMKCELLLYKLYKVWMQVLFLWW